jgi:uncharacterized protein (UPF0218 family)
MPVITERAREELKKPLGRVYGSMEAVRRLSAGRRIISVGDACTLVLLDAGIRPHLAVFDFKCMRSPLAEEGVARLKAEYPEPVRYANPPGTLSDRIVSDAPMLLERGGAVLVDGEEDLTALAFIMAGTDKEIVIYGQPNAGMVLVRPGAEVKDKISRLLRQG